MYRVKFPESTKIKKKKKAYWRNQKSGLWPISMTKLPKFNEHFEAIEADFSLQAPSIPQSPNLHFCVYIFFFNTRYWTKTLTWFS